MVTKVIVSLTLDYTYNSPVLYYPNTFQQISVKRDAFLEAYKFKLVLLSVEFIDCKFKIVLLSINVLLNLKLLY